MEKHIANTPVTSNRKLLGYLVEFTDVGTLIAACEKIRDAGYTKWDAHTPFPVHGLNDAMGLKPTLLPYFVLLCGIAGGLLALLMQWWMNAVDYPLIISGKPLFSIPANIPIVFELTVLLAGVGAFVGMMVFNGLPRYHHPVFHSKRFESASDDRFFISIETGDPRFDAVETRKLLESLGGTYLEELAG